MTTKFSPRAILRRTFTSLAAIAAVCVIFASKAIEHDKVAAAQIISSTVTH